MRLTVRLFGHEVLDISTEGDDDGPFRGDCTTQPIGFVARMDVPHEVEVPDRDW